MPLTLTDTTLEVNLQALGERNADLAQQIRATLPPVDFTLEEAADGALTGTLNGRRLASRNQPLAEAERLIEKVDWVNHAAVVVIGFGLGHHVAALARRIRKTGVIIVFEPDLSLLRVALEQIDHSDWLPETHLIIINQPDDRAELNRKLTGGEGLIAQGLTILPHPPSRARIGTDGDRLSRHIAEYVQTVRTTFLTTLVRAVDTVRNLCGNIIHYAAGPPAESFKAVAFGRTAICVSAGPSLERNLHLLQDPSIRERAVIIAVQTTLKPLLKAGIKPHFVTALDYHEISTRFYESLTPEELEGVTLIADPKAHPSILNAFPGTVCCLHSDFLNRILSTLVRPMGEMPAGATVAHLAVYLAKFLGCQRIALIGQDLAFTDGLYYAPGTAIHDVWTPELGPFNTIAMMEWQRIMRHRRHLSLIEDQQGRHIYTDLQMRTYLHQFERDFADLTRDGIEIIDATEGGAKKAHCKQQTLQQVIDALEPNPLPETLRAIPAAQEIDRVRHLLPRLEEVRDDANELADISDRTINILNQMLEHQQDFPRMQQLFKEIDAARRKVDERTEIFEILNFVNQLGSFRRLKADRRLHLTEHEMTPIEKQRHELERDQINVVWIRDAARELAQLMDQVTARITGEAVTEVESRLLERVEQESPVPLPGKELNRPGESATTNTSTGSHSEFNESESADQGTVTVTTEPARIGALVPIDPVRAGRGTRRSLDTRLGEHSILNRTITRLEQSIGESALDEIILIAPAGWQPPEDCRQWWRAPDGKNNPREPGENPVKLVETPKNTPLYGPEQPAIQAARAFNPSAWRGGIAGMSIFDEALTSPQLLSEVMQQHGLTDAVLCPPDWPFQSAHPKFGLPALLKRHRRHRQKLPFTFTTSVSGVGGYVLTRDFLQSLTPRSRRDGIGPHLVYQPDIPNADPISIDTCLQVPQNWRQSRVRITADSERQIAVINKLIEQFGDAIWDMDDQLIGHVEQASYELAGSLPPRQIAIEIPSPETSWGSSQDQLFEQLTHWTNRFDDLTVTFFSRSGDPINHPELGRFIAAAKQAGALAIEVKTELRGDAGAVHALMQAMPEVISVMIQPEREQEVINIIQEMLPLREHLSGPENMGAIALPWIVPRMIRQADSLETINPFFERWQTALGTAVIDPAPVITHGGEKVSDSLLPAVTPRAQLIDTLQQRMMILADGTVPISECTTSETPLRGEPMDLPRFWQEVTSRRQAIIYESIADDPRLELLFP